MKYQGIFFDLDGTLLPMDYNTFMKGYLGMLSAAVAPYGYEPKAMLCAMWQGVEKMMKNDGTRTNYQVFWEHFASRLGERCWDDIDKFDAFYSDGFHKCAAFTSPTPLAKRAVELAREKSTCVVLATNPFFPPVAVDSRLSWANISPGAFDLITHYENSSYCKPNPQYFTWICEKFTLDPTQCLMIGNNADEDIEAAQKAGLDTFLLTDCLIAEHGIPETKQGDFPALISFLESL